MLVRQQNAHYKSSPNYNYWYGGLVQSAHACRAPGFAVVVGGCSNSAPLPAGLPTPSAPADNGVSSSDISGLKLALAAAAPEDVKNILDSIQHTQLGGGAYTVIISTFGRRGELEKARQVFEYVPLQQRNVWHVTAICSSYANAGDWQSAVKQLKQSAAEGVDHPQLAPNTITYSTVIEACARTGRLDVAVDLFQEMFAAALKPDPVTYAILLTHFSRVADWDQVNSLLDEMHSKGMAARTPMYAGYIRHLCQSYNWNRALSLYLITKDLGAEVTAPIYSELLQALSGAGKPCMVAQLLQEAHQDDVPHTGRLLDTSLAHLQALGHHDKASTLHDLMMRQGWAPSPAYIPYPAPEDEAVAQWDAEPADVPTYHKASSGEDTGAVVAPGMAANSNSGRPSSSSSECSAVSSYCSYGAACEAGRGKLYQHDHPTGSFPSCVGLPADSTSDTPATPPSTAVGCFSSMLSPARTDISFASRYSRASRHSWSSSSVSKAGSDRGCLSVNASPAASPVRPQQATVPNCHRADCLLSANNSPRHSASAETAVAAPLMASLGQPQHTHAVRPAQIRADIGSSSVNAAGSSSGTAASSSSGSGSSDAAAGFRSTKGATGAAVSAGGGMFGPCYAYIPTHGPSGMMYTVAGPYYYDAGGNWFRLGGLSVN